jgi:N-acetylated-alpha-linked acidic dipeptidase
MNIQNKEEIKPIQNLFAKIKGTVEPDREIILGNHRDAWVFGSIDPHGGTISFLEVVKSFSYLISNTNWRPRRTIVFASWDAEEHGLLGSTEWVEHYRNILKNRVVAYLNVDTNSGLNFDVMTSPALAEIVREVSTQLLSPLTKNSTLDKDWNNKTDGFVGKQQFKVKKRWRI